MSVVALFAIFCVTTYGTNLLCRDSEGYTSFWPPNAAMLVGLLVLRPCLATLLLVACTAADMLVLRNNTFPVVTSALIWALNLLQVLIAAPLTRRYCGATTSLLHPRHYAAFLVIACVSSAMEGAIGVLIETYMLGDPSTPFPEWLQWVFCDALGLIIATPALIGFVRRRRRSHRPRRERLAAALVAFSLCLSAASFLLGRSPLFLLLFPALVLVALHASPNACLFLLLGVAVIASATTAHGIGPIARLSPDGKLMREAFIQPYLLALVLVVVPTNNVVVAKRRYARHLALLRAQMSHVAAHDTLTRAESRSAIRAAIGAVIVRRAGGALLLIDIDFFKPVNDTFGHHVGDLVLVEFADRLLAVGSPRRGRVGRLGGDEFAMLITLPVTYDELDLLCSELERRVREPFTIDGQGMALTASIGALLIGADHVKMDDVMQQADRALYHAKGAGRNRHAIIGPTEPLAPVVPVGPVHHTLA